MIAMSASDTALTKLDTTPTGGIAGNSLPRPRSTWDVGDQVDARRPLDERGFVAGHCCLLPLRSGSPRAPRAGVEPLRPPPRARRKDGSPLIG